MVTSRRTLIIVLTVLAVSLMINIFLGGLIAGRLLRHEAGATRLAAVMGERLPADTRRLLRREILDHRQELRAAVDAIRAARADVAKAVAADPYDAEAANAAFARLRAATDQLQEVTHRLVMESAAQMDPEMRKRLAGRWQRVLERSGNSN